MTSNKVILLDMHGLYSYIVDTHLPIFHDAGSHDYSRTFIVIYNLPQVPDGGCHWSLSYDVGLLMLVALMIILIQIR